MLISFLPSLDIQRNVVMRFCQETVHMLIFFVDLFSNYGFYQWRNQDLTWGRGGKKLFFRLFIGDMIHRDMNILEYRAK